MLRLPLDVTVPRATVAGLAQRARSRPRGSEVRVRVRGDALVARRWVGGPFATGHCVLRARLDQSTEGVRVHGTVAPSGLDLTLVLIWFVAALGVVCIAAGQSALALVALVPLGFGAGYAASLPRDVRRGREVLVRTLQTGL